MSATLEERVAALEKELVDLKKLLRRVVVQKDWRRTFGMSADDPGLDEMLRLGREIQSETERSTTEDFALDTDALAELDRLPNPLKQRDEQAAPLTPAPPASPARARP
jgi:hypothetical protein